jgi:ADP-ribosyl-[dinitrogen reductase] hydrolase
MSLTPHERFVGVLLGTAVGDSLGLPAEGLSPECIRRRWKGKWKHRLVLGKGMLSDDTEHTLMVAQALLAQPEDAVAFQRALAWKFRWWLVGLPGGVGKATAKACIKLWAGVPATRSAVTSAGSGPAMRSAILGAFFAGEPERRHKFVMASSRLTHQSWQAETAALAVAEVVALTFEEQCLPAAQKVISALRTLSTEAEWQTLLSQTHASITDGASVSCFVESLGMKKGVSGYSLHVVGVALYACLRHANDFRTTLTTVLDCGGDTDTAGAIAGAVAGAALGKAEIPAEWLRGILEWPRSPEFIERLAERLAAQKNEQQPLGALLYFWPALIPRNVAFIFIVLTHGLRRLFPPY